MVEKASQFLMLAGFPEQHFIEMCVDPVKEESWVYSLGPTSIMGEENEKRLVAHTLEFEKSCFPLTVTDVRKLAFGFACNSCIINKFSKAEGMAGLDWWHGIRARCGHLVTVRKPQSRSRSTQIKIY